MNSLKLGKRQNWYFYSISAWNGWTIGSGMSSIEKILLLEMLVVPTLPAVTRPGMVTVTTILTFSYDKMSPLTTPLRLKGSKDIVLGHRQL